MSDMLKQKPSREHLENIKMYWNNTNNKQALRYLANDELIRKIFSIDKYKSNSDKKIVALKASLIDHCYSTNLKEGFYDACQNICNNNIDKELKNKTNIEDRASLIAEICKVESTQAKDKKKSALSFMSKYLAWHTECIEEFKNNSFPIIDRNVTIMLGIAEKEKYKSEKEKYIHFVTKIDEFKEKFNMKDVSYWNLDHYLWSWSKLILFENKQKNTQKEKILKEFLKDLPHIKILKK